MTSERAAQAALIICWLRFHCHAVTAMVDEFPEFRISNIEIPWEFTCRDDKLIALISLVSINNDPLVRAFLPNQQSMSPENIPVDIRSGKNDSLVCHGENVL